MIFVAEEVDRAAGGVLAQGVKGNGYSFKKGRVLSADDVALLAANGFKTIVVARVGPDDVGEDEARRPASLQRSPEWAWRRHPPPPAAPISTRQPTACC